MCLRMDAGKDGYYEDKVAEMLHMDELTPEIVMTVLGIRHVGDTLVGSEKLRGVSGGPPPLLNPRCKIESKNFLLICVGSHKHMHARAHAHKNPPPCYVLPNLHPCTGTRAQCVFGITPSSTTPGQRKRLTTGEILVTRTPVLLADEISTGLDSATTFDICCALRSTARVSNRTIAISAVVLTRKGVFCNGFQV